MGKNDKVRDNKKTLWALVIILLVSGVAILSISVVILSSGHKEPEKKTMEEYAQDARDRLAESQKAAEESKSELKIARKTVVDNLIDAIKAYKTIYGDYPKDLNELNNKTDSSYGEDWLTYTYDGSSNPIIQYKVVDDTYTESIQ